MAPAPVPAHSTSVMPQLVQYGTAVLRRIPLFARCWKTPLAVLYPNLQMKRVFTLEERFEFPPVDHDLELVPYAPEMERRWLDLLNTSREFRRWDLGRLRSRILNEMIPGSAYLAVRSDQPVGCCAATFSDQYKPYAVITYLLVLPDFRRRGLGSALVMSTLASCHRAGYPGVILHTTPQRTSAIATYLSLGFTPDVNVDCVNRQLWPDVLRNMRRRGILSVDGP